MVQTHTILFRFRKNKNYKDPYIYKWTIQNWQQTDLYKRSSTHLESNLQKG